MTQTTSDPTTNRLGPFPAGATPAELVALVQQGSLGLRLLDREEQARDYYRTRCEALEKAAAEFFFAYPGTQALIFQKNRETALLPDFTEYVLCWFAENRLCGTILSGVTSDAGTHAQINEQETACEEHAAEVVDALGRKYPERPRAFLNYFDFVIQTAPPESAGEADDESFTHFTRLATIVEDNTPRTRVESASCGPVLLHLEARTHSSEIPTGSTHSSQRSRSSFANPECLVLYDFLVERYVRTIESIHVCENLIYISRTLANDLGRKLNASQSAQLRDQTQAEINKWLSALSRAEEAKQARVQHLMEIL